MADASDVDEALDFDFPEPTLGDVPSPLILAKAQAIRSKAPEDIQAYESLRDDVARLNNPETPWEERLGLLDRLRADGWQQWPSWPKVERHWKYGGKEWRVTLTEEEWSALQGAEGGLEGMAARGVLAEAYSRWLKAHPELAPRIIADIENFHYLGAWVAVRLWGGSDENFCRWVMDNIIAPVTKFGAVSGAARAVNLPQEDLRQNVYSGFIIDTLANSIPAIRGRLDNYWREAVKHSCIDATREHARAVRLPDPQALQDLMRDGELMRDESVLEDLEDLKPQPLAQWDQFRLSLSPRQQKIVIVKGNLASDTRLSNRQVAHKLGVSLSTVEKELHEIRVKGRRYGLTFPP